MFQHIGRRGLMGLAIVTMLVAAAALAGHGTASGQALTGAMTLEIIGGDCTGDDCFVTPGADFEIAIVAWQVPAAEISGLQAELFFDGITWNEQGCLNELQVARQDAQPVSQCLGQAGAVGQAHYVVVSEIAAAPLPPLAMASGDTLFLLSATCDVDGPHTLDLTAVTNATNDAPFGAVYFDINTTAILVTTQGTTSQDFDGDTTPETLALADSVNVTCGERPVPPPPGATATPLSVSPTIVSTGSGGPMEDGGSSTALLIATIAMLAATAGGYGLYRWRVSRAA